MPAEEALIQIVANREQTSMIVEALHAYAKRQRGWAEGHRYSGPAQKEQRAKCRALAKQAETAAQQIREGWPKGFARV